MADVTSGRHTGASDHCVVQAEDSLISTGGGAGHVAERAVQRLPKRLLSASSTPPRT